MYPKLRHKTTSRCVADRAIFDKALDESSDRSSSDEDAEVPLAEDIGLQRQELAQRWMTQQSSPPRAFISSTSIDLPEYQPGSRRYLLDDGLHAARHAALAGARRDRRRGLPAQSRRHQRFHRHLAVGDLAGELAKGPAGGGKIGLSHLYTYKETSAETAKRFADVLIAATQGGATTVVLTLRADFTDRALDEHRPLCDRLQEASVLVGAWRSLCYARCDQGRCL